jgi:hypothetical protein
MAAMTASSARNCAGQHILLAESRKSPLATTITGSGMSDILPSPLMNVHRSHIRTVFAAAVICAAPLQAQRISPGFWAGATVSELIAASGKGGEGRPSYLVGPFLDVAIWRGVRAPAALLFGAAPLPESTRPTAHRWELPVTASWQTRALPGRPYVRAGVAWNRIFAIRGARGSPEAELRHRGTYGLVIGGGLDFGAGPVRLTPEVRVVRWVDRNFGVRDSALRSNLTEVQLLAGVRF